MHAKNKVLRLQVEVGGVSTHNPTILSIQSEKGEMKMAEPKQKVAGLYVRISTDGGRQDTMLQQNELRALATKRGWTIHKIYEDRESGAKVSRPGLDELWRDCRRGKLDVVAIWSLDRLARSVTQLVGALEEFRRLGIDFVSLRQEGMDTTTPGGRLLYHVISSVAEFERELIRERVVAGMNQARREGRKIGRPTRKEFSPVEIAEIRKARQKDQASIRALSKRFDATEYMVNQVLAQNAAT
jgi:DNA invertase Pin-like site-specific DNA recombinase